VAVGLAGLAVAGLAARPQSTPPPQQTPPVFRGNTQVVPVDVRVLDGSGKPVTGLTQDDFTILEDGVRQQIRLFAATTLTPAATSEPLRRVGSDVAPAAQNRRVFLIVLGRGRLQPPARGVDALLKFVRERLMPQDQVALFAFNRSTDFTSDHAYLAAVLERFRKAHEDIDAKIRQRSFEDATALYGVSVIPPSVQSDIDDLFRVPGGPALRTPPAATATTEARIRDDVRVAGEAVVGRALADASAAAGATRLSSGAGGHLIDAGFGDFIADSGRGLQDLTKLYQGIEYLRSLDGEKHLIFVTERGMSLPRLEDHVSVAAMANDARVAIDVIQTGGLPGGSEAALTSGVLGASPTLRTGMAPGATSLPQSFTVHSLRTIAELTGGLSSIYDYATTAVDRLATATTSSYLIGYVPTNAAMDGSYRRITVQVNRRGTKVHWRHGYYAQDQRLPFDRRQALTYNRIATAMNFAGTVRDIGVDMKIAEGRDTSGRWLQADIRIDPARLSWTIDAGDRLGSLDVAVIVADQEDALAGEHWQRVNLRLTPEVFERAKTAGLTYGVRMALKAEPTSIKVIVYDFAADRLGSAMRRLR
jgi:VWFA-related protein